ncbi:MAG: coproporphyrinogen III oxidase [Sarcina sp.]
MYINIGLNNLDYRYDVYQMFNIFYSFDDIKFNEEKNFNYEVNIETEKVTIKENDEVYVYKIREDKNLKEEIKKAIFLYLTDKLKDFYPWGTLVGIRPSKIALKLLNEGKSEAAIINYFEDKYSASDEKAKLCIEVAKRENVYVNKDEKNIAIYVGMPFCPTRCMYCSFAANPIGSYKNQVENYLEALLKEIKAIENYVKEKELTIETVYFGGGTPTAVNNQQFERVMNEIHKSFLANREVKEFTVECGRPDSITREKLETMKNYNVSRISINPQTMNDEVLTAIGRGHLSQDVIDKYKLARELEFDNINMDIIIGLPNEDIKSVQKTVTEIEKLNPDSLTVHGMSIKRASKLHENLVLKKTITVANQEELNKMYDMSKALAKDLNMEPYYMYRQKNMVGNMENVGFSRVGKECLYNMQMIEDTQTIIALGADAVSKVVYLNENKNRIERFANVKDVKGYIDRIDEMIEGKIALLNTVF